MSKRIENQKISFVSIIVPVRNEEIYIGECLESLSNQTYSKDKMEILILDGMSEDRTRKIVNRYILLVNQKMEDRKLSNKNEKNRSSLIIRLINNPKMNRAAALNIGIKEAEGDVIIRIDARTRIPPNYIEKCVKTLHETGADNVGGVQKPIIHSIPSSKRQLMTQETIGIVLSHPFGIGNAQFRLGKKSGYVDTVYLGCFRREVFNKVGLFDEDAPVISEDADINQRIRDAGGKIYLNKNITAYYYPRDNFKDLWKLYFRYGGAKAGNFIKRKKLTAIRQIVPPSFLFSIIILILLSFLTRYALYLLIFIISSYFILNCIVSLSLCFKRKKLLLFPFLLSSFPILHFSWALGFWKRLLQRAKHGAYWRY